MPRRPSATNLLAAGFIAGALGSCGGDPESQLSPQATLRDQHTILLDEDLAWQYQHLLDRVGAEAPTVPKQICVAVPPGRCPIETVAQGPATLYPG